MTVVLPSVLVVATGVSTAEYLAGDWPAHSQLVDGEVLVTDPRFRHQFIVGWLYRKLADHVDAGPTRGLVAMGGNWVAPLEGHVYCPDVWWVSEARRGVATGSFADGLPDLVVEVGSPGTWSIDLGRKRDVYDAGDTIELWLVDTTNDRVLVDRRSASTGRFERVHELAPPAMLVTPLLPGLELDLAEAFAR